MQQRVHIDPSQIGRVARRFHDVGHDLDSALRASPDLASGAVGHWGDPGPLQSFAERYQATAQQAGATVELIAQAVDGIGARLGHIATALSRQDQDAAQQFHSLAGTGEATPLTRHPVGESTP
jgi:hypothetical protein